MTEYEKFIEQRKVEKTRAEASAYQGLMRTMKRVQRVDKAWKLVLDVDDPLRKFTFVKPFDDKHTIVMSLWHREGRRRQQGHSYYDPSRYFDVYQIALCVRTQGADDVYNRHTQIKPDGRGLVPKILEAEKVIRSTVAAQIKHREDIRMESEKKIKTFKEHVGPYWFETVSSTHVGDPEVGYTINNGRLVPQEASWRSTIRLQLSNEPSLPLHLTLGLNVTGAKAQAILKLLEEAA